MSYTINITHTYPNDNNRKISREETINVQNGEVKISDILERMVEYLCLISKLPQEIVNKRIEHHSLYYDNKYLIDSQKLQFTPMDNFHQAIPINGKYYAVVPVSSLESFSPIQYQHPQQAISTAL